MARRDRDQQGDGNETGGRPGRGKKGDQGSRQDDADVGYTDRDGDGDIERATGGDRGDRSSDGDSAGSRESGGTSDGDEATDSGTGSVDGTADLEGSEYDGYGASDRYRAAADQIDLTGGRRGTGRSGDANYDVDEEEDEEQGLRRGAMGAIETSRPESPGTTSDPDDMSGTRGTSGSSGNLGDSASYGPGSGRDEGRFS
jgi:hypothetical protein